MSGAKIATRVRNTSTASPASATLSRRSRSHAICPRERPSTLPMPERTASGAAVVASEPASKGKLTR